MENVTEFSWHIFTLKFWHYPGLAPSGDGRKKLQNMYNTWCYILYRTIHRSLWANKMMMMMIQSLQSQYNVTCHGRRYQAIGLQPIYQCYRGPVGIMSNVKRLNWLSRWLTCNDCTLAGLTRVAHGDRLSINCSIGLTVVIRKLYRSILYSIYA